MLRVSRGILKGKRLPATDRDLVGVRPFTSRMRKSLFDLLSFEIKGSVFWDIFCGSGIVGIEALSLGAGCVYFVDKNKRLLLLIKRFLNENNLHMMGSFFLKNLDLTKDAFVSSDEPDIVEWMLRTATLSVVEGTPPFESMIFVASVVPSSSTLS